MELARLIKRASAAYPDDLVKDYFDAKNGKVRSKHPYGEDDGLARFICVEIVETFNTDASDTRQLQAASKAILRAAEDCRNVAIVLRVGAIMNRMDKKPRSRSKLSAKTPTGSENAERKETPKATGGGAAVRLGHQEK